MDDSKPKAPAIQAETSTTDHQLLPETNNSTTKAPVADLAGTEVGLSAQPTAVVTQTELSSVTEANLSSNATADTAETAEISAQQSKKGELASRTHRLLASLIDSFIHLLAFLPLFWFVGLDSIKSPSPLQTLLFALYGMTTYVLIHGYLLYHYGQTIGKSEFGMRIQLLNGEKASLQHVMLWRYLPIMLMNFVPVIGQFLAGVFNVLFIFGKQRRCLHDYIAGTEVRYYYDMPEQNPPN